MSALANQQNLAIGASVEPSTEQIFHRAAAGLRSRRRPRHPKLREAMELLDRKEPHDAERILAKFLEKHPGDTGALDLMAEVALQMGQTERAEPLLAQCIENAPALAITRYHYASTLFQRNKSLQALAHLEQLLREDSDNALYLDLNALILSAIGRHGESVACCRRLAEVYPDSPEIWVKYGWSLRSMGQREQAVLALRKAIELRPSYGEAHWSLADMKAFEFSDEEIRAMECQLARPEVSGEDRMYLHFALGTAYGGRKLYAKSFENYARANAIKRLTLDYDPGWLARHVAKCKTLFTRDFLQARTGTGCPSSDPIFIIGMQRAGSTLVEQILASHPAIAGTAELPDLSLLAEHIGEKIAPQYRSDYPGVLSHIDAGLLRELGERYIETTRFRRTPGRPHFTDKMPYNFLHVGLIHLILPNAKIIDVRRHPLACCFSNFSINFKYGALFAYRLAELGHAYADYVELMAHFDAVLPGRMLRVFYEDLVRNPEAEVRRVLAHTGLPFDEACLRFHENRRTMDSVSSEQVRRPISTDAVDTWRNYEPWLGSLKSALGPVLEAYPDAPSFAPARPE